MRKIAMKRPAELRWRSGGGARNRRETSSNGVMTTESGPGGWRRSMNPRVMPVDDENGLVAPDPDDGTSFGMPEPDGDVGPESAISSSASAGSSKTPHNSPPELSPGAGVPAKPIIVGAESTGIAGDVGAPPADNIDASGVNCDVSTAGAAFHSMSALSLAADSLRGRAAGLLPSRNPSSPSLA